MPVLPDPILYHGANYLLEELWLKGHIPEEKTPWFNLHFAAHYFAHMNMGDQPVVRWNESVPDWFSIHYPWGYARPSYGFATDVHSRQPHWPHPGYPLPDRAYRTFSWQLHPCIKARCLHLFQVDATEPVEHRIGHAWYEELYKPVIAVYDAPTPKKLRKAA